MTTSASAGNNGSYGGYNGSSAGNGDMTTSASAGNIGSYGGYNGSSAGNGDMTTPASAGNNGPYGQKSFAELVQEVKQICSSNYADRNFWGKWCETHMSGRKDPAWMDEATLTDFIKTWKLSKPRPPPRAPPAHLMNGR